MTDQVRHEPASTVEHEVGLSESGRRAVWRQTCTCRWRTRWCITPHEAALEMREHFDVCTQEVPEATPEQALFESEPETEPEPTVREQVIECLEDDDVLAFLLGRLETLRQQVLPVMGMDSVKWDGYQAGGVTFPGRVTHMDMSGGNTRLPGERPDWQWMASGSAGGAGVRRPVSFGPGVGGGAGFGTAGGVMPTYGGMEIITDRHVPNDGTVWGVPPGFVHDLDWEQGPPPAKADDTVTLTVPTDDDGFFTLAPGDRVPVEAVPDMGPGIYVIADPETGRDNVVRIADPNDPQAGDVFLDTRGIRRTITAVGRDIALAFPTDSNAHERTHLLFDIARSWSAPAPEVGC